MRANTIQIILDRSLFSVGPSPKTSIGIVIRTRKDRLDVIVKEVQGKLRETKAGETRYLLAPKVLHYYGTYMVCGLVVQAGVAWWSMTIMSRYLLIMKKPADWILICIISDATPLFTKHGISKSLSSKGQQEAPAPCSTLTVVPALMRYS